nr:MAG TPA: hypothetical protein [Caudoviricetes sp.]
MFPDHKSFLSGFKPLSPTGYTKVSSMRIKWLCR